MLLACKTSVMAGSAQIRTAVRATMVEDVRCPEADYACPTAAIRVGTVIAVEHSRAGTFILVTAHIAIEPLVMTRPNFESTSNFCSKRIHELRKYCGLKSWRHPDQV